MTLSAIRAWSTSCRNGNPVVLLLCSGICLQLFSVCALFLINESSQDCIDFYPAVVITLNLALATMVWYLLRNVLDTIPLWTKIAAASYVIISVTSSVYLNSDNRVIVLNMKLDLKYIHGQVSSTFCLYDSKGILLPIVIETISLYTPAFGLFCYISRKKSKLKRDFEQTHLQIISPCAGLQDDRTYCYACEKINQETVTLMKMYGIVLLIIRPIVHLFNNIVGGPCTDIVPVVFHLGGCALLSVLNIYYRKYATKLKESPKSTLPLHTKIMDVD
ncbi:uncharacterized protein LOC132549255 [Ylistrum balloti]|uniref:uncharacterized protein LOC132549255 n=1 Tax=Ylistrum balloti TaxID=509963 RepID=UPI00290582C2|nr:uncharacterized protein LOC132549255 [Ylistrum balloti]